MPNKTKSLTSLFDLKILNILFFSFAYATDNKISPEVKFEFIKLKDIYKDLVYLEKF